MERPKLSDYSVMPNSTTTGACYNYKNYAYALDSYINWLKKQAVEPRNESEEVCNCEPDKVCDVCYEQKGWVKDGNIFTLQT